MRINKRLRGTVADRPIDSVVTQAGPVPIPAQDVRRNRPSSMMNTIERITSMMNGTGPVASEDWLADTPLYDKG